MADRFKVTLKLKTGVGASNTHLVTFITESKEVAEEVVKATAIGMCSSGCEWEASWYDPEHSHPWQAATLCVSKSKPPANLTKS